MYVGIVQISNSHIKAHLHNITDPNLMIILNFSGK